jgi:hypothetical protein
MISGVFKNNGRIDGSKSISIKHGSLEDVLGSTKMTWKTKAGDGCGVMLGVQNNGF